MKVMNEQRIILFTAREVFYAEEELDIKSMVYKIKTAQPEMVELYNSI